MQLEILPEAFEELAQAVDWLNDDRVGLGEELVDAVDLAVRGLLRAPFIGAPVPHRKLSEEHRRMLVRRFRYVVIYRIRGDVLQVVAIAHTSRSQTYWMGR